MDYMLDWFNVVLLQCRAKFPLQHWIGLLKQQYEWWKVTAEGESWGGERGRNRLSAPDAKFNNLNSNNSHIVSTHSIGRVVIRITNTHKNQDWKDKSLLWWCSKKGIFEMNHSHTETIVTFQNEMFCTSREKKHLPKGFKNNWFNVPLEDSLKLK